MSNQTEKACGWWRGSSESLLVSSIQGLNSIPTVAWAITSKVHSPRWTTVHSSYTRTGLWSLMKKAVDFYFLTKLTPLMAVEKVAFTPTVHDLCLPLLAVKSNNKKAFNTWFKHTEPTQTAQANQSLQLIYKGKKTTQNQTKPGD